MCWLLVRWMRCGGGSRNEKGAPPAPPPPPRPLHTPGSASSGAGKTTTISMLCGMYGPSQGTATVNGYDIRSDMHHVHLSIGLCPQHDILWHKHLSAEDHLLFYARLKGVPPHAEKVQPSPRPLAPT